MKGILETIPEFFQIFAALAVAVLLFILLFQLTNVFRNSSDANLSGDKLKISSTLASYIETCWDQNRDGLSPTSSVCKFVNLTSLVRVSEIDITKKLDCEFIPNNKCLPNDCSFCTSKRYSDQDKVKWFITDDMNFTISYDGSERSVHVGEPEP